jgi:hypothetical protein
MGKLFRQIAALLLSLLLRVPYVVGVLCGFFALCVVAFWAGFYRVYGENNG